MFMDIVFGIIVGFLVLMFLVVAHEFGHFIMARRNGVKVNEFGIGMPPRIVAWTKKHGKWQKIPKSDYDKPQDGLVFSLNWLPIGGFCSMDGESAADQRPGTFGAASFWSKTKILFGGVAMNWIVAFVILTILSLCGIPQFMEHQFYLGQDAEITQNYTNAVVEEVFTDTPAEAAGFQSGDIILQIADTKITDPHQVIDLGKTHAGEKTPYTIQRGEEVMTLEPTLNPSEQKQALGIQLAGYAQTIIRSTWSAPLVGLCTTVQLTGETFRGLWQLITNLFSGIVQQFSFDANVRETGQSALQEVGDSVSGPVGIIGKLFPDSVDAGLPTLALLAAIISVSLACMNILPIPALDGGRWLLIAIYKLRKKPLTKETEERVVSRAFMVLLMLIFIITVLDIIRLF